MRTPARSNVSTAMAPTAATTAERATRRGMTEPRVRNSRESQRRPSYSIIAVSVALTRPVR